MSDGTIPLGENPQLWYGKCMPDTNPVVISPNFRTGSSTMGGVGWAVGVQFVKAEGRYQEKTIN